MSPSRSRISSEPDYNIFKENIRLVLYDRSIFAFAENRVIGGFTRNSGLVRVAAKFRQIVR